MKEQKTTESDIGAESKEESDTDHSDTEYKDDEQPDNDSLEYAGYAGASQDKEWMDHTKDINIKQEQKIYDKLLEYMGCFKWQSSQYVLYVILC